jgi:DNA integrity scanning protein DisA with diadenylate cyclase activity
MLSPSREHPPAGGRAVAVIDRSFVDRRRERLRAELLDAGARLDLDTPHGERVLAEIDYARCPPRHERHIAAYGALVGVGGFRADALPGEHVAWQPEGSSTHLRLMADGRNSFYAPAPAGARLVVVGRVLDTEADLVRLQHSERQRLVVIQRTVEGIVRVLGPEALIVWDQTRWWTKPYADLYQAKVAASMPNCPAATLASILELCVHVLGPAATGATLVWDPDREPRTRSPRLAPSGSPLALPEPSVLNPVFHGAIQHFLAQVDGATIVDRDGHIVETGVRLAWSDQAEQCVQVRSDRGTRHGSAKRYTFDDHRVVVFVVSEAGPVTVYAHGQTVASIDDHTPGSSRASAPDSPFTLETPQRSEVP